MGCDQEVIVNSNKQTRQAISSFLQATTKQEKLHALHFLLYLFCNSPESRIEALKEKVVTTLLRQRNACHDKDILSLLQQGLCMVGYVDPPKGHGIKILAIDGGGVRGIVPLKAMMKLEKLTGKPIYELFDYVCGVSTGAIQACSIFPQKKSLDEIVNYYKELNKEVFQSNILAGAGRFLKTHGYYDSSKWEGLLKNMVGTTKMLETSRDKTCPKISAISTLVNVENKREYIFRNYEYRHNVRSKYQGSSEYLLWEAVRASTAAQAYFQEFKLGNQLYQDGGLKANNPCSIAIYEARLLWPGEDLQCIISLGTGQSRSNLNTRNISKTTWADKVRTIVDSATDTEAVHNSLSEGFPNDKYFRFNPYLTEMIAMDEVQPEKMNQLELDADAYYYQNEERFQAAAQALLKPRRITQKFRDWLGLKANELGLRSNL